MASTQTNGKNMKYCQSTCNHTRCYMLKRANEYKCPEDTTSSTSHFAELESQSEKQLRLFCRASQCHHQRCHFLRSALLMDEPEIDWVEKPKPEPMKEPDVVIASSSLPVPAPATPVIRPSTGAQDPLLHNPKIETAIYVKPDKAKMDEWTEEQFEAERKRREWKTEYFGIIWRIKTRKHVDLFDFMALGNFMTQAIQPTTDLSPMAQWRAKYMAKHYRMMGAIHRKHAIMLDQKTASLPPKKE